MRCTSSQMQSDSAVSRALTLKGRKDNSPGSNKMRRDASGSETQNFAPCGKYHSGLYCFGQFMHYENPGAITL